MNMRRIIPMLLFVVAFTYMSFGQKATLTQTSTKKSRVDELLSKMTLEEKVGQMNQYNGFWDATGPAPEAGDSKFKYDHLKSGKVGSVLNVTGAENVRGMQETVVNESRLGIPLIFGLDVIHGHKTLSPIPLAEAASWDLEAIERSARIAATEASARGINWTFAPMVDISRDARWGRVMEGAGEDPYLGSKIGAARVRGFQGDNLSDDNTIAACAKHFAGYGFAEAGKDYNTAEISMTTLYNIVLPPFKACVDAGICTFMNSFNTLNGIPSTGDSFLQRDILKKKWSFEGFVVSDWGSGIEMIAHGFAKDRKDVAVIATNAGSDMDMESYANVNHLEEAVNEGLVTEAYIDDAVRRILKVKEDLGLFDDPYKYCDTKREEKLVYNPEFRKEVLDVAKKSIVLLKNEGNILPISKTQNSLAVIGTLAEEKTSPLGNWRLESDDGTAVSVLEGLDNMGIKYKYAEGAKLSIGKEGFIHELEINNTDKSQFDEAIRLAKESETVLLVLGEHGYQSGEGRSRAHLGLPGVQQELLEAVYAVNPNIVLILMTGRPLVLTWADEHIPSILNTWQLGSEAGNAIAEVLVGNYNPSGKLPMSFPRAVGQVPIYYNHLNTGRPGPKDHVFWSHYTDEENSPLYPFGYGLSYSEFSYSNLQVNNTYETDGKVKVSITLQNKGTKPGREVAQLYIRDMVASVSRPVRELKGFRLVDLAVGETKVVEFELTKEELGFFNNNGEYIVEKGDFQVFVGGDSNATNSGSFELK
jgi:beta-glucosidase